ncbi:MAG: hypothetical protein E5Y31_24310 [Mesorhizobium sp.]|nr:MAG: hypothetical protein E5Y31_24310 [Mesorhizobium sp.]
MRDSAWGKLKEPSITTPFNIFAQIVGPREVTSGLSEADKLRLKYRTFLNMTPSKFREVNVNSCRVVEDKREIDEVALRKFLDKAVESEIHAEFGEVPSIKI